MKTLPTHIFVTKAHSLSKLFESVHKMSTFMTKLEREATQDPLRYDPFKYLGDGFEYFVELFLMLHPCDNRIGIYDYTPVESDDNGVDGVGVNIFNEKSVAQIKYRSDTKAFLTADKDQLSNMFSDGMLKHNVVADIVNPKNYRHFVFTTAEGLNFYTDQSMFKSKVHCIGYNDFRAMLDNNMSFWKKAQEIALILDKKNNR